MSGRNAVIIGGGIVGLASAKALSRYFDQVDIFDAAGARQAPHLHVLMKHGQTLLNDMFPGILDELQMEGCHEIDWALDTCWENVSGGFPRYKSHIKTLSIGRPLLEEMIVARLMQEQNIFFHKKAVDRLIVENGKVSGVVTSLGESVECTELVLAGGQNFPLEQMLSENVTKSRVDYEVNLTYRSFIFKLGDIRLEGAKQYYYQLDPPRSKLGGVICPIGRDRVVVTLIEYEPHMSPCRSYESFLEKAKTIPGLKFHSIISEAAPVSEMFVYRKGMSFMRKLNERKIPQGVYILGDIVASLNPVFGQGMTLGLRQVDMLDKNLGKRNHNVDFHSQLPGLVAGAHRLSSIGSSSGGFSRFALRCLMFGCQRSRFMHLQFLKYLHMVRFQKGTL